MNAAIGLDRAWLAANLPHQGAMSLLDAVTHWDAASIRAVSRRHGATDHPLRRGDILPIAAGIEYGAQAAAAHGALVSGQASRGGYLASVRAVRFAASRLDDVEGALEILARNLGGDESGALYAFEVRSEGRTLVEGRVAVAFR